MIHHIITGSMMLGFLTALGIVVYQGIVTADFVTIGLGSTGIVLSIYAAYNHFAACFIKKE